MERKTAWNEYKKKDMKKLIQLLQEKILSQLMEKKSQSTLKLMLKTFHGENLE